MEQNLKFKYKTRLSFTNLITPSIGMVLLYLAFTNTSGLAYRGKLVLPYPVSSYFYTFVGVLMLLPLFWLLIKMQKSHYIGLSKEYFEFTKGLIKTKKIKVKYSDVGKISIENDDDDGKLIVIDTGKFFDRKFYANKFKTPTEFSKFYKELQTRSRNTKEKELKSFMLGGIYFTYGYGGIDVVKNIIADKTRKISNHDSLLEAYKEIFLFAYEKDQKSEIFSDFESMWGINNSTDLINTINRFKSRNGLYKAWDYTRIVQIASMGYACDYLTKEEVKTIVLDLLPLAQKQYENWTKYHEDFIKGRIEWSPNNGEKEVYQKLADEITIYKKSIYAMLPLNSQ